VIDVEDTKLIETGILERGQILFPDFVACLGKDLARLFIHEFIGEEKAMEILIADQKILDSILGYLSCEARRDLLSGFDDNLAGLRID
jgi:hypothetical protein